jgi:hypothetical protein
MMEKVQKPSNSEIFISSLKVSKPEGQAEVKKKKIIALHPDFCKCCFYMCLIVFMLSLGAFIELKNVMG